MRYLVTGANRGIGLEFVRQLAERDDTVIATARKPEEAEALQTLASKHAEQITIVPLEVTSPESVQALEDRLLTTELDVLINNAGRGGSSGTPGSWDFDLIAKVYETNVIGSMRVLQAAWPALSRGRHQRIAQISSRMGSIASNTSGGGYAYRMSKAALNMANRSIALDLADKGAVTVVMHPGWVQTDMGGSKAPLTPETSVRGMLTVIDGLAAEHNGQFINWDGEPIPW